MLDVTEIRLVLVDGGTIERGDFMLHFDDDEGREKLESLELWWVGDPAVHDDYTIYRRVP